MSRDVRMPNKKKSFYNKKKNTIRLHLTVWGEMSPCLLRVAGSPCHLLWCGAFLNVTL